VSNNLERERATEKLLTPAQSNVKFQGASRAVNVLQQGGEREQTMPRKPQSWSGTSLDQKLKTLKMGTARRLLRGVRDDQKEKKGGKKLRVGQLVSTISSVGKKKSGAAFQDRYGLERQSLRFGRAQRTPKN